MSKPKAAFWIKETKTGKEYLSGNVEIDGVKTYVNLFRNEKATGNQPVWRTIDDKPEETRQPYPTSNDVKNDGLPF